MGVTSKLLALYRVDQQLSGLKGRLRSAEAYLRQQDTLIQQIESKRSELEAKLRELESTNHNDDVEIKSIDERIAGLRDRMNSARTSREHSALLSEVNTLKTDRGKIEDRVLQNISRLEEKKTELASVDSELEERRKIREVAKADRDKQEAEIKGRVEELEGQRAEAAKDVPASALDLYQNALDRGFDDIMAPVEEHDRRSMDYTCGSCYTHLPIEKVNVLLNRGDITTCPACDTILYISTDLRESFQSKKPDSRSRRTVSAQ